MREHIASSPSAEQMTAQSEVRNKIMVERIPLHCGATLNMTPGM